MLRLFSRRGVGPALWFLLALYGAAYAQSVNTFMEGTVTDPANAVVVAAVVELKDQGTGAVRQTLTDEHGFYHFLSLPSGTYAVTVTAPGFKSTHISNLVIALNEMRYIPVELVLGNVSESVSVSGETTPVQVASSEKAAYIESAQLQSVALKGRDVFGMMNLLPGVVDTANRDVTSPNGLNNITINGLSTSKNFTVDGVTNMGTSGDATAHYEPNMDAIQELKVLGSNYQAEFGRNSGGTISVVTKSGSRQFHGTGWWNHRHEEFNANDFFRNQNGQSRLPYRYNVEGWTFGGPAYIPKVFNSGRSKLFFFASQEYTGQKNGAAGTLPIGVPASTQFRSVPTALERAGNFSQSLSGSGALIVVNDPTTGAPFPGNIIPANRFNQVGSNLLNLMPLPNYAPPQGNPNYLQDNYQDSGVAPHPRRNDVIRADLNLTSKLSGYFRFIHDYDDTQDIPFFTFPWSSCCLVDHPNPGHGYGASATYIITPTLVNDFTFGKSYNQWAWTEKSPASLQRSILGNIPYLYQHNFDPSDPNGDRDYIPNVTFGGSTPPNPASFAIGMGNYANRNDIWSFADNVSKVWGSHAVKAGFYYERTYKVQPPQGARNSNGTMNFTPDTTNPLNTGDSYASALLGYLTSYTESSIRVVENLKIDLAEFYVQENWHVSKRFTLDYGLRLYHHSPLVDLNRSIGIFDPALYSASAAPRLYVPGCTIKPASGTCPIPNRVAIDPGTGAQAAFAYVGAFVPGSGNPAVGMFTPGSGSRPLEFYHQRAVAFAPRFGFAWDVTGNGKTAIRGGYGIFYNTLNVNSLGVQTAQGLPPVGYSANISYASINSIVAGQGVNAPVNVASPVGEAKWDYVQSYSLGIQRSFLGAVLDLSYVGNQAVHLPLQANINAVPLGADFANVSPVTGSALTQATSSLLRPAYPGLLNINQLQFIGRSNYNALQVTFNRRFSHGLQYGASYTWGHAMALTTFDPLVANNRARNYGPPATDRRQVLAINYAYTIPNLGKRMNNRFIGAVTDHWMISGVATFATGAPFTPTCTSSTGADITGSVSETPRCQIIGDLRATPAIPGTLFNTAAIALPPVGSIGNAGLGQLVGPGGSNWDITVNKNVPVAERARFKLGLQAYNAFNHTQRSAWGSAAAFSPAGVNTTSSLGFPTAARAARILATSLRFEF